MTRETAKTALVIGATGGAGGETARALLARGWRVRAMHRNPEAGARAADLPGAEWVKGDAMNPVDVIAAADGAHVIVHAANPPGYRNWNKLILPMIENVVAAAKASGARIAFPGSVYNFGPDAFPVLNENSPQNPTTRKGLLRKALEQRLEQAAKEGARTIILRCGDFFGPRAGNNWFAQALIKPGKPVRSIAYPGPHGVAHAWAYLPDVGETFARLLEREADLPDFAVFHLRGHQLEPGVEMAEAIRRVVGDPRLPIRPMSWALLALVAPFNETMREIREMRYLWREPVLLDNSRLVALLGAEPHTPLDVAVRTTLEHLGCLPNRRPSDASWPPEQLRNAS